MGNRKVPHEGPHLIRRLLLVFGLRPERSQHELHLNSERQHRRETFKGHWLSHLGQTLPPPRQAIGKEYNSMKHNWSTGACLNDPFMEAVLWPVNFHVTTISRFLRDLISREAFTLITPNEFLLCPSNRSLTGSNFVRTDPMDDTATFYGLYTNFMWNTNGRIAEEPPACSELSIDHTILHSQPRAHYNPTIGV